METTMQDPADSILSQLDRLDPHLRYSYLKEALRTVEREALERAAKECETEAARFGEGLVSAAFRAVADTCARRIRKLALNGDTPGDETEHS